MFNYLRKKLVDAWRPCRPVEIQELSFYSRLTTAQLKELVTLIKNKVRYYTVNTCCVAAVVVLVYALGKIQGWY